jgi:hypothetical protein
MMDRPHEFKVFTSGLLSLTWALITNGKQFFINFLSIFSGYFLLESLQLTGNKLFINAGFSHSLWASFITKVGLVKARKNNKSVIFRSRHLKRLGI